MKYEKDDDIDNKASNYKISVTAKEPLWPGYIPPPNEKCRPRHFFDTSNCKSSF